MVTLEEIDAKLNVAPDTCFDNVGRYVVCGNGAVKDNLTGLFWLEDADCFGGLTWAGASVTVAQLGDGQCGLTDGSSPGDWRLPTQAEWEIVLTQAVSNGCSAPFIPDTLGTGCCGVDPCAFNNTLLLSHWSSTTVASSPPDARLAFAGGTIVNSKLAVRLVWPVRGGQ